MVNKGSELQTVEGQVALIGISDPQRIIDDAIKAAKVLVAVISQKKNPVMMGLEQYLEFEDWQILGQFYHMAVSTGDAVPVEIDGVKGAKAKATLINLHTGEIIGGAEGYCMRDEPKWSTRPKYEYQEQADGTNLKVKVGDEPVPWFQLASMAQTRAGAKAHRNRLAWIAALAGYKTTPAEELQGNESPKEKKATDTTSKYYCQKHKVTWFKKGAMRGYAHPVEGTKEWCSMPADKPEEKAEQAPPTSEPSTTANKQPEGTTETPQGQTAKEKAVYPKISLDRVDQLSRALAAAGYLPGEVREALFKGMKIAKLQDLDTNQGDSLEAFCKRKEAEKGMKLPFEGE